MSAPENEMGDADGQIGAPLEHASRMEGRANVHEEHGAAADEGKKPSFGLLRPHLNAGHDLIPLHKWDSRDGDGKPRGKAPRDPGWPGLGYAAIDWRAHMECGGNVGVRLRDTDLVIDVDPRHFEDIWDSTDPFSELVLQLGLDRAGPLGQPGAERRGLTLELLLGQGREPLFVPVNGVDDRLDALAVAVEAGAEDRGHEGFDHAGSKYNR